VFVINQIGFPWRIWWPNEDSTSTEITRSRIN